MLERQEAQDLMDERVQLELLELRALLVTVGQLDPQVCLVQLEPRAF